MSDLDSQSNPNDDNLIAARAALDAVLPRLRALPAEQISRPRLDVETATIALRPIAAMVASAPVRARFAKLPADEFDPRLIDDLATLVLATRYANTLHLSATAAGGRDVRVPLDLVQQGADVRSRMLSLATYWFDEDPEVRPEVDAIRAGHGHKDLARDLNRLAALYRKHPEIVSLDARHYRAEDPDLADQLAERIYHELGLGPAGRPETGDVLDRAWSLLQRTYEPIAAFGRAFFLYQNGDVLFPSLYSLRPEPKHHRRQQQPAPQQAQQPVAGTPS